MTTSTGFQQFVNNQLPVGVAGDFASANPFANVQAPPGGFVAAPNGLTVGCFAWGNPLTRVASNYYQANSGLGFVHRENNALITTFLGISSMQVLAGMMATLMNQGDFWGLFTAGATVGQKVYADAVLGTLSAGAAGAGVAGTLTGSVAVGGLMTVSAITGTPLLVGQSVYATGIPIGSYISALGSGTGGTGTYQLANAAGAPYIVVSSGTINYQGLVETPFYCASNVAAAASVTGLIAATGVLTVTAVGSGSLEAGQFLSATVGGISIPSNIQILSQITATSPAFPTGGGTGTYLTNAPAGFVLGSGTVTAVAGQLGKISSWGP